MRIVNALCCGLPAPRLVAPVFALIVALTLGCEPLLAQQPAGAKPAAESPAPAGPSAAAAKQPAPPTKPSPDATAEKQPPAKSAPAASAKAEPAAAAKTPAATPPKKQPPAEPTAEPEAELPQYDELPMDEEQGKARLQITKILRTGSIPPSTQQTFEDYYKTYALARWTSSEFRNKLPECRRDLRRELLTAKGAAHDQLVALAFEFLTDMAKNESFHPAPRCNAMLAIGELNAQEPPRAMELPVPLPAALPVMIEGLTDAKQIDAVRVAALLGLLRHATIGIADAQLRNTQVAPEMLRLAESKSESGRSVDGHAWVRARAIDVLAALRQVGQQNAVALALGSIVGQQGGHLLPRYSAARALGMLQYPQNHGMNPSQLAAGLGQLAVDACDAELAHIERETLEEEEKKKRKRMPGMSAYGSGSESYPGYPGGYSGEEADAEMDTEYDEEAYPGGYPGEMPYGSRSPYGARKEEKREDPALNNRRRLMKYLNAVLFGLTGMDWENWKVAKRQAKETSPQINGVGGLATAPPHQPFVAAVLEHVEQLLTFCTPKGDDEEILDKEAFRAELEELLTQLRTALSSVPAVASAGQPATGS